LLYCDICIGKGKGKGKRVFI